ncbi:hypothetical protein F5B22DRAFT_100493 [Xylaria bambusicola]|uniref:uncharacterized protein n=1 Tax=Xylaria bambusicola TaxID=326684 RepID=UPI002007A8F0|nr:uncharacterized protein F5B22DRAFT_100493 [Xylaria bambusicola]KAI0517798.1 hypothetical protein F5B22DRAFT_100493 [Xylaria bambusicola]
MKRKQSGSADALELVHSVARRQPQTSCLNCRAKKIKCDRGTPCASCVIRGLICSGQPDAKPPAVPLHNVVDTAADASILSRLATLERTVFGDSRPTPGAVHSHGSSTGTKNDLQPSPVASAQLTDVTSPSPLSHHDTERHKAAKYLDSTHTKYDHNITPQEHHTQFHVAPASCHQVSF